MSDWIVVGLLLASEHFDNEQRYRNEEKKGWMVEIWFKDSGTGWDWEITSVWGRDRYLHFVYISDKKFLYRKLSIHFACICNSRWISRFRAYILGFSRGENRFLVFYMHSTNEHVSSEWIHICRIRFLKTKNCNRSCKLKFATFRNMLIRKCGKFCLQQTHTFNICSTCGVLHFCVQVFTFIWIKSAQLKMSKMQMHVTHIQRGRKCRQIVRSAYYPNSVWRKSCYRVCMRNIYRWTQLDK